MTKINLKSTITGESKTSDINVVLDTVATVTSPSGETKTIVYDPSTPSTEIVIDSTSYSGINIEPHYIEEMTETVERSKGLLDGGFKFSLKLPKALGGFAIDLERKPREETRTIKKAIFRTPPKNK